MITKRARLTRNAEYEDLKKGIAEYRASRRRR
jgi:hypothetical protein